VSGIPVFIRDDDHQLSTTIFHTLPSPSLPSRLSRPPDIIMCKGFRTCYCVSPTQYSPGVLRWPLDSAPVYIPRAGALDKSLDQAKKQKKKKSVRWHPSIPLPADMVAGLQTCQVSSRWSESDGSDCSDAESPYHSSLILRKSPRIDGFYQLYNSAMPHQRPRDFPKVGGTPKARPYDIICAYSSLPASCSC
jgi:hypothetical protein